jgi:hypothetical protein
MIQLTHSGILSSKADAVSGTNILGNSDFTIDYANNFGSFRTSDIQSNWVHPGSPRWNWDGANDYTTTDNVGAQRMMQGINDNSSTTGNQTLRFEIVSCSGGQNFRVYVWGINGTGWSVTHWNLTAQPSGGTLIDTLLDSGNIAAPYTNEIIEYTIDCGTGYDYLLFCFGVDSNTGETLILDNIEFLVS